MGIYIFIDDESNPSDVKGVKLPKVKQWHVCRSYSGFVKLIESLEEAPAFVSFGEKAGVSCAKALINVACDNHWKMPGVQVHTTDPVGKKNILDTLTNGEKWVEINSSRGM